MCVQNSLKIDHPFSQKGEVEVKFSLDNLFHMYVSPILYDGRTHFYHVEFKDKKFHLIAYAKSVDQLIYSVNKAFINITKIKR